MTKICHGVEVAYKTMGRFGHHHYTEVYVGGGVMEVQPHLVSVLADTAARAQDLDEAKALAARQRAEEAVRDRTDKIELAEAQAELLRAMAQLKAIERLRKKR